eukprot:COSAG06_NODE_601_length_13893_cov_8.766928_3_plen_122_part_00
MADGPVCGAGLFRLSLHSAFARGFLFQRWRSVLALRVEDDASIPVYASPFEDLQYAYRLAYIGTQTHLMRGLPARRRQHKYTYTLPLARLWIYCQHLKCPCGRLNSDRSRFTKAECRSRSI